MIGDWTEDNFDFVGYVQGFDPAGVACLGSAGATHLSPAGIIRLDSAGATCLDAAGTACLGPTGATHLSPAGITCLDPTGVVCLHSAASSAGRAFRRSQSAPTTWQATSASPTT